VTFLNTFLCVQTVHCQFVRLMHDTEEWQNRKYCTNLVSWYDWHSIRSSVMWW